MAPPLSPTPVKLFVATLHQSGFDLDPVVRKLQERFGEIDFVSKDFPFQETDYYAAEMGTALLRRFLSFSRVVDPSDLAAIKLATNTVEEEHRSPSGRRINLDPGIIDFYKVVLASAKFGGQKVYLRDGIYADMTLVHFKGKWESFAWGFPDFKSGRYDEVLTRIRELYKAQMKPVKQPAS